MSLPVSAAEDWYGRICRLKVDRARPEPAPHKPLLLLVFFDMLETGQLSDGMLELTPSLAFRFSVYASVVAHRRSQPLLVIFPFFHLRSDGFWQVLDENRQPTSDRNRARYAMIDPDFLMAASDPGFRQRARLLLIAKYFHPEDRAALYSLCDMKVPDEDAVAEQVRYQPIAEATKKGRDARFRIMVLSNYTFTCALTRYRLTTVSSECIVDAAHIHQFAASRNDDPRNGLALCKNAHWLFDNGLWSLTDDYRVVVARGRFEEECLDPGTKGLLDYEGASIHLPRDQSKWPALPNLRWHRKNRFKGAI
ncbi:MAG: HNH endonuclease [Isosphaeraceae bacterium]|jgi:putative restriction endonuclease